MCIQYVCAGVKRPNEEVPTGESCGLMGMVTERGAVPAGQRQREMERDASQSVILNVIHRPDAQINAT